MEFLNLEEEILFLKGFKIFGIAVCMLFVLYWSYLSSFLLFDNLVTSPPCTSVEHFSARTLLTHWKSLEKYDERTELPSTPKILILHTLVVILYPVHKI